MSLEAWHRVCDKWAKSGYASLTAHEQIWFNVRSLVDAVHNGGLISYFYNTGANTYSDMMAALDELGAVEVRSQVKRVSELFSGGVPTDHTVRNDMINSWADGDHVDGLLDEVDDKLMPMMSRLEKSLEQYLLRRN